MTTPVYCKDCVYFQDTYASEFSRCQRPVERSRGEALISPKIPYSRPLAIHCAVERAPGRNSCGPDAKYFKPKPAPWWHGLARLMWSW